MAPEALVDQLAEAGPVRAQQLTTLFEGHPGGGVAAVVGHVAGGLVRQQLNRHLVLVEVLEQVDHVAVVGDGQRRARGSGPQHPADGLSEVRGHPADPPLGVAGLDARPVDLGDDAGPTGDLERLRLGPGHSPQARRDEGPAAEVRVVGDPQVQPPGVEQGDVGAVDDPLRADVHPAAGGHLAVVHATEGCQPLELLRGVEHPHHQAVGDDGAGRLRSRGEQAQRVPGHHHQGLVRLYQLEVALDEPVLHPVLADLPGLAVGDQLVRVERDLEVEVVVDHHLHGAPLEGGAAVGVHRPTPDPPRGAVAVAVDPAHGPQLIHELRRHRLVVGLGHVAEGVGQGDGGFTSVEGEPAARRAADPCLERLRLRQLGQLDVGGVAGHGRHLRCEHCSPARRSASNRSRTRSRFLPARSRGAGCGTVRQ